MFFAATGKVRGDVDTKSERTKTEEQLKLEQKEAQERIQAKRRAMAKVSMEDVAELALPADTSRVMKAKKIRIVGNTLITTEEILLNIPLVYNDSELPIKEAQSLKLYDLRSVHEIIDTPGRTRQITARTVRGLTQSILAIYQEKGYSGIYVSVPDEAFDANKQLRGDILLVNITEAPVTSVTIDYFTPENEQVEDGYLSRSFLEEWSPVKVGEVGKQKELNEFINLLNINPDRYMSAKVSKGERPDTLAVSYNIYEANPWHWFLQVDNSGTEDRRYAPKVGLINTNLLGFDDKFMAVYQAPWEKGMEDRFSVYGSYDFPIMGPKLRLELFAGYSEFDIDGSNDIDFLGRGHLYGGKLRYNLFQTDGWFFDVTTSLAEEKSKVSTSKFTAIFGSQVRMILWGVGVDVHRRTDMANTSIKAERLENIDGSDQDSFWNSTTLTGARTNAERDFSLYTISGNHSQYLDADKVQRLTGSGKWIIPNDRLVPAKMTLFGGMYTVRGYKESGLIADGGILASVQYEYDLVRAEMAEGVSSPSLEEKPLLRKLAPLVFFDYGRAEIEDKVAGERGAEDLYSVGVGSIIELGDHFSGAVYYGWPLEATSNTDTDDGRLNFSLMLRW
jgi:hemolysin activation/secretion protein